ncbi:MAG: SGNH/GDSL hydrolase family protein, partial [Acidimicrobiales bacterium]
ACTPLRVTIVGDSITKQGAPQYHAVLDPTYALVVDGTDSGTILSRAAAIDALAADPPHAFIMNLGTGDAGNGSTTIVADWMAQMAKFSRPTVKVGVTIWSESHWGPPLLTPFPIDKGASELNTWIRVGAWAGQYRLVDWDRFAHDYLANGEPYGPLFIDHLHPTPLGQTILGQLYRDALQGS